MADPPTVVLTMVLTVTTQGGRVWLPVTKIGNIECLDHYYIHVYKLGKGGGEGLAICNENQRH